MNNYTVSKRQHRIHMYKHYYAETLHNGGKAEVREAAPALPKETGRHPLGQGDWLLGQVFQDSFQDMPETGWFKE